MPRRRSNHIEMSASSGPKVAALPDADQQSLRERVLPERRRRGRGGVAERHRDGPADHRHHDAEAIGQPAHRDAAEAEPDHRQRVGERRVAARDAELGLHRRQRDDDRPHADAADRRQHQRPRRAAPTRRSTRLRLPARARESARRGRIALRFRRIAAGRAHARRRRTGSGWSRSAPPGRAGSRGTCARRRTRSRNQSRRGTRRQALAASHDALAARYFAMLASAPHGACASNSAHALYRIRSAASTSISASAIGNWTPGSARSGARRRPGPSRSGSRGR